MNRRINPYATNIALLQPLIDYAHTVQAMGLERSLVLLVEIRASQINGCAVCLQMHAAEARRQGETEDRILMLDAWAECQLYSEREKAALAWTDVLTRLTETHAPDDSYAALRAHFSEEEQVKLTLTIGVINIFNRIGVGFRVGPVNLQAAA
jgi:AhpD family alkylhydroperoxidase